MSRDPVLYVDDMHEAASRALDYTRGLTQQQFAADRKTIDAVVRNLEVLGEAAKRVPEELRRLAPEIEWRRIAGLRDVLAHEYFGIDLEIVWDVLVNKPPPLLPLLERLRSPAAP